MAKDDIPKTAGMPNSVYRRSLALVRDYCRLVEEVDAITQASPANDGQPHGSEPGDPTAAAAIRREEMLKDIKAVENALHLVPHEIRLIIFENIAGGPDGKGIPLYKFPESHWIHRNTISNWRTRFLRAVARNKGWID